MSGIEKVRNLLRQHLTELDEERRNLERALAALGSSKTRRSPGRPRGSTAKRGATPKAPGKQRKRRGGGRASQALKLIEKTPGINASEIAKAMKIKPNYLYRVLSELGKEGRVKKQGRKYFPAG